LVVGAAVVMAMEKINPYYVCNTDMAAGEHNCRDLKCGFQTYIGAFSCLYASLFNEGLQLLFIRISHVVQMVTHTLNKTCQNRKNVVMYVLFYAYLRALLLC